MVLRRTGISQPRKVLLAQLCGHQGNFANELHAYMTTCTCTTRLREMQIKGKGVNKSEEFMDVL